jgi:RNA polymerase sigma factor (sigma-70 family)
MSSMLERPALVLDATAAETPLSAPAHLRLVPDAALDFDDAVRRITPRLQRYARRRLGDAHEAEELVQEALLRAFKHGDALRTEDDLTAWCTVVTGRLVIDRLRVRGRSTTMADVPEGARVARDTADVVVARDEARMALDALDAMPSRQAAALWAREVEGLSYDEIGRRFTMTEPAVRSLLTRARKALRKEYAERGGTLPVAGLAVLAPWVRSLRWADRLRSAATRVTAPAALGAVALGLVGGALHSPLFGPPAGPVGTVQAVVSRSAVQATAIRAVGVAHPAATGPSHEAGVPAPTHRRATHPSLLERAPTSTSCVRASSRGYAGGDSCVGGGHGSRLWVNRPLPDNPTGAHYVGVESDRIDCRSVPTAPGSPLTCSPRPTHHSQGDPS